MSTNIPLLLLNDVRASFPDIPFSKDTFLTLAKEINTTLEAEFKLSFVLIPFEPKLLSSKLEILSPKTPLFTFILLNNVFFIFSFEKRDRFFNVKIFNPEYVKSNYHQEVLIKNKEGFPSLLHQPFVEFCNLERNKLLSTVWMNLLLKSLEQRRDFISSESFIYDVCFQLLGGIKKEPLPYEESPLFYQKPAKSLNCAISIFRIVRAVFFHHAPTSQTGFEKYKCFKILIKVKQLEDLVKNTPLTPSDIESCKTSLQKVYRGLSNKIQNPFIEPLLRSLMARLEDVQKALLILEEAQKSKGRISLKTCSPFLLSVDLKLAPVSPLKEPLPKEAVSNLKTTSFIECTSFNPLSNIDRYNITSLLKHLNFSLFPKLNFDFEKDAFLLYSREFLDELERNITAEFNIFKWKQLSLLLPSFQDENFWEGLTEESSLLWMKNLFFLLQTLIYTTEKLYSSLTDEVIKKLHIDSRCNEPSLILIKAQLEFFLSKLARYNLKNTPYKEKDIHLTCPPLFLKTSFFLSLEEQFVYNSLYEECLKIEKENSNPFALYPYCGLVFYTSFTSDDKLTAKIVSGETLPLSVLILRSALTQRSFYLENFSVSTKHLFETFHSELNHSSVYPLGKEKLRSETITANPSWYSSENLEPYFVGFATTTSPHTNITDFFSVTELPYNWEKFSLGIQTLRTWDALYLAPSLRYNRLLNLYKKEEEQWMFDNKKREIFFYYLFSNDTFLLHLDKPLLLLQVLQFLKKSIASVEKNVVFSQKERLFARTSLLSTAALFEKQLEKAKEKKLLSLDSTTENQQKLKEQLSSKNPLEQLSAVFFFIRLVPDVTEPFSIETFSSYLFSSYLFFLASQCFIENIPKFEGNKEISFLKVRAFLFLHLPSLEKALRDPSNGYKNTKLFTHYLENLLQVGPLKLIITTSRKSTEIKVEGKEKLPIALFTLFAASSKENTISFNILSRFRSLVMGRQIINVEAFSTLLPSLGVISNVTYDEETYKGTFIANHTEIYSFIKKADWGSEIYKISDPQGTSFIIDVQNKIFQQELPYGYLQQGKDFKVTCVNGVHYRQELTTSYYVFTECQQKRENFGTFLGETPQKATIYNFEGNYFFLHSSGKWESKKFPGFYWIESPSPSFKGVYLKTADNRFKCLLYDLYSKSPHECDCKEVEGKISYQTTNPLGIEFLIKAYCELNDFEAALKFLPSLVLLKKPLNIHFPSLPDPKQIAFKLKLLCTEIPLQLASPRTPDSITRNLTLYYQELSNIPPLLHLTLNEEHFLIRLFLKRPFSRDSSLENSPLLLKYRLKTLNENESQTPLSCLPFFNSNSRFSTEWSDWSPSSSESEENISFSEIKQVFDFSRSFFQANYNELYRVARNGLQNEKQPLKEYLKILIHITKYFSIYKEALFLLTVLDCPESYPPSPGIRPSDNKNYTPLSKENRIDEVSIVDFKALDILSLLRITLSNHLPEITLSLPSLEEPNLLKTEAELVEWLRSFAMKNAQNFCSYKGDKKRELSFKEISALFLLFNWKEALREKTYLRENVDLIFCERSVFNILLNKRKKFAHRILYKLDSPLARYFLLYEYLQGVFLREAQVHLISLSYEKNGNEAIRDIFLSPTGSGKTSHLIPAITWLKLGKRLVFNIWPTSLFDENMSSLNQSQGNFKRNQIGTIPFLFNRSAPIDDGSLVFLLELFNFAYVTNTPISTTSLSLQSFKLAFIERTYHLTDSRTLYFMGSLLSLMRKGLNILDEPQNDLSPFKDLNFAIGEKRSLPKEEVELLSSVFEDLEEALPSKYSLTKGEYYKLPDGEKTKVLECALTKSLKRLLFSKKCPLSPEILSFVLGKSPLSKEIPYELLEELSLLRGLFVNLLTKALSKRPQVHFGLSDKTPYALPFEAADTPVIDSEFANIQITTVKTFLSYLYKGLSSKESFQIIELMKKKFFSENSLAKTLEKLYALFPEIPPLLENIPLAELTEGDMRKVLPSLKGILFYVTTFVCPSIQVNSKILSSTGASLLESATTAFSATPGPEELYQTPINTPYNKRDESLKNLLSSKNLSIKFIRKFSLTNLFETCSKNLQMFVDGCAALKGVHIPTFAAFIFRKLPSIERFIYYKGSQKWVLEKNSKIPHELFEEAPFFPSDFIFCDHFHSFGVNCKLPERAAALVTVNATTNTEELLQSVGRLREFNKYQTATLILEEEMHSLLEQEEGESLIKRLVSFTTRNLDRSNEQIRWKALKNQIDAKLQKVALDDVLSKEEGVDMEWALLRVVSCFVKEIPISPSKQYAYEKKMVSGKEALLFYIDQKIEEALRLELPIKELTDLKRYITKVEATLLPAEIELESLRLNLSDIVTTFSSSLNVQNTTCLPLRSDYHLASYPKVLSKIWPSNATLSHLYPLVTPGKQNSTEVELYPFYKALSLSIKNKRQNFFELLFPPNEHFLFDTTNNFILLENDISLRDPLNDSGLIPQELLLLQEGNTFLILVLNVTEDSPWVVEQLSKNTSKACLYDLVNGIIIHGQNSFSEEELKNNMELQKNLIRLKLYGFSSLFQEDELPLLEQILRENSDEWLEFFEMAKNLRASEEIERFKEFIEPLIFKFT